MPVRVQRKRTKGWKMPYNTRYCGRGGYFGNPFTGDTAVNAYRRWLEGKMSVAEFERRNVRPFVHHFDRRNILRETAELRGKNLACWCKLSDPCHADVLLEIANRPVCT